jgi:AcrR family transcriptional regulator
MPAPRKKSADARGKLRERAVDVALRLAEEGAWERVRLRRIAAELGVPLPEVLAEFRDLDAVADAWFARLLSAMLAPAPEGFGMRPAKERVKALMLRWFDAAQPHRRVTVDMLKTKLYPSHPHHWVPMAFHLSRLIQWVRDAGGLDAGGRRRQIEEIALTSLFLAALAVWAGDDTPGQRRTREFLERWLDRAEAAAARLFGPE